MLWNETGHVRGGVMELTCPWSFYSSMRGVWINSVRKEADRIRGLVELTCPLHCRSFYSCSSFGIPLENETCSPDVTGE